MMRTVEALTIIRAEFMVDTGDTPMLVGFALFPIVRTFRICLRLRLY